MIESAYLPSNQEGVVVKQWFDTRRQVGAHLEADASVVLQIYVMNVGLSCF